MPVLLLWWQLPDFPFGHCRRRGLRAHLSPASRGDRGFTVGREACSCYWHERRPDLWDTERGSDPAPKSGGQTSSRRQRACRNGSLCGGPWYIIDHTYLIFFRLFSLVEGRSSNPWLALLRAALTYTTDAYQLNCLRTAERPTGLIFTNGWCS